jgi:hypothetical protein
MLLSHVSPIRDFSEKSEFFSPNLYFLKLNYVCKCLAKLISPEMKKVRLSQSLRFLKIDGPEARTPETSNSNTKMIFEFISFARLWSVCRGMPPSIYKIFFIPQHSFLDDRILICDAAYFLMFISVILVHTFHIVTTIMNVDEGSFVYQTT